jgi:membrane protein YdbS with pleckstrin-like domain
VPDSDWQHPSDRLITVRRVQVGSATLVVLLVVVLASLATGNALTALVLGGLTLVGGGGLLAVSQRRFRAWGYQQRAEDLVVRRGVMFQRLSVVPYGRMQFVDVTAGPFERAFGLATVRLHTAAAASDARIPGLAAADAAALRDSLAARGEARSMGL